MGVTLRDPIPYFRVFPRKLRKPRTGFGHGTSRLSVLRVTTPPLVRRFERRTAQPLIGSRMDSIDVHALPGIRVRELWCSSQLH